MANNHNILSQSFFSDLRAQGANDEQILQMMGVQQLPKSTPKPANPPSNPSPNPNNTPNPNLNPSQPPQNNRINNIANNNNNVLKSSKDEEDNRQNQIALEILMSVQRGNKEVYIGSEDLEILKREDYPEEFVNVSNGVCSFLGRKNNLLFDTDYQFNYPYSRVQLLNNGNNNNNINNIDGEEVVVSSLIFNHSSVAFIRKSLPKIPIVKEESHLVLGENGLATITNPSFSPLVYEWKRNEVIGEASDISDSIKAKAKGNFPYSGVADEEGKYIFMSCVENHPNREVNIVEWPVDMSLKSRLFNLYSYDVSDNINVDDDNLSFYSPARRNRVILEENFNHEVKITKNWIILFTHTNNFIKSSDKILFYFIERSSIPKRPEIEINFDISDNNPQNLDKIELNSFKVEIKGFEGKINDISFAFEDGNGSNVCISIIPAGNSFHKNERIEKSDILRSKSSRQLLSSFSASRLNNSISGNSHAPNHRVEDGVIGLPCGDQNADSKPNFIRHIFVDPRNPPAMQISREIVFDKALKGSVAMINQRSLSRDGFLYLSLGGWPELDIHRTSDSTNLLLPPPLRHFPALFNAEKSFLFENATWISGVAFIPDIHRANDSFSFSDDRGYIVVNAVTSEEGKLIEEINIFDSKEFEKGPAFVIRPKYPLENSFNFGVSNYTAVWGEKTSLH